jgi:hypothetical protein
MGISIGLIGLLFLKEPERGLFEKIENEKSGEKVEP